MAFIHDLIVHIKTMIHGVTVPVGLAWLAAIILVMGIYRILTRWLDAALVRAAHGDRSRMRRPLRIWRIAYWTTAALVFIAVTGGNIAALGISAAFVGMILGWSLQRPVTGIAAWLLITVTRTFKVGDRVIIAGVIGDVKEIGIMYITMEQVGGTIGGEEKSGRAVLIPTAVLFDQVIYNYTMRQTEAQESKYILDEIVVRVSHDSSWTEAERILIAAARVVTQDIVAETKQEPFIRGEFIDWGIFMRLRYNTRPTQRQEISSNITKIIFAEFAQSRDVRFAYPRSESDITYALRDTRRPPFHP